jgi:hypothetical protein
MAHYDIYIINGQSNAQGVLSRTNAPAGTFTGTILNGISCWNATTVTAFDVATIGPNGNGHTWIGAGSSSSGNYAWPHLILSKIKDLGQNPLVVAVTEGGSSLRLTNIDNGSHNVNVTALTTTYPLTPVLHTELVNRYNACIAWLGANSHTFTVRGVFWDQGEADLNTLDNRQTDLTAKFASYRSLTGVANLPIYYCTRPAVGGNYNVPYMDKVDLDLAIANPNNICMKLYNGSTFDGAHFDATTMLAIRDWMMTKINNSTSTARVQLNPLANIGITYNHLQKAIQYINITDSAQLNSLNYFIPQMKTQNLFDKRIGIFMMLGSDYSKNIKNPNYKPLLINGATSISTGLDFDGINDSVSGNVRLLDYPTMTNSNFSLCFYLRDNALGTDQSLAVFGGAGTFLVRCYIPFTNNLRMDMGDAAFNLSNGVVNTRGFYSFVVKNGNARIFKNGKLVGVKPYVANHFLNDLLKLGQDVSDTRYLNNTLSYFSYGEGLTDSEVETYYNIVYSALTFTNRTVSDDMPIPTFQAVIDYANTNSIPLPSGTVLNALETYINTVGGIIRRFNSVHIFANGGSAETFANINLVSPGTHTMTWPNGKTYSINGVSLNGTNQYGDWSFNGNSTTEKYNLIRASRHYWIGTVGGTVCDGTMTTGNRNNLSLTNTTSHRLNSSSTGMPVAVDMSGTGLKIISSIDDVNTVLYNHGVKSIRAHVKNGRTNENQVLGKAGTSYGSSTYRSAKIGDGITDAEELILRNAEIAYYAAIGL